MLSLLYTVKYQLLFTKRIAINGLRSPLSACFHWLKTCSGRVELADWLTDKLTDSLPDKLPDIAAAAPRTRRSFTIGKSNGKRKLKPYHMSCPPVAQERESSSSRSLPPPWAISPGSIVMFAAYEPERTTLVCGTICPHTYRCVAVPQGNHHGAIESSSKPSDSW